MGIASPDAGARPAPADYKPANPMVTPKTESQDTAQAAKPDASQKAPATEAPIDADATGAPSSEAPQQPETFTPERTNVEAQTVANNILNHAMDEAHKKVLTMPDDETETSSGVKNDPVINALENLRFISELPPTQGEETYTTDGNQVNTPGLYVDINGRRTQVKGIRSGDDTDFRCWIGGSTTPVTIPREQIIQGLVLSDRDALLQNFPEGSPQRQLVETYMKTLDPKQKEAVLADPATQEIIKTAAESTGMPTTNDFAEIIINFSVVSKEGQTLQQRAEQDAKRDQALERLKGKTILTADDALAVVQDLGCTPDAMKNYAGQAEEQLRLYETVFTQNPTPENARNLEGAKNLSKMMGSLKTEGFAENGPIHQGFKNLIEGRMSVEDSQKMMKAWKTGKFEEIAAALVEDAEKKGRPLNKKDIQRMLTDGGIGLGALFWLYSYLMQQIGGTQQQR